jgi:hypothetical protein
MRATLAACSYGPTDLRPIPAAVEELTAAEQLELGELLVQLAGGSWQHQRLAAAAALRERHGFVEPAVSSVRVRDRLAAVDRWATTATLDVLASDDSFRVRIRARSEKHQRQQWRFVRGLE